MAGEHPAEARIADLSISRPDELDVEAIAYDFGVEVRYGDLSGCDATLVGYGARGIATIQRQSIRTRRRFSIGHELGHWEHHRGQSFRCRVDEISDRSEEHTSELQSHSFISYAVFCFKKKHSKFAAAALSRKARAGQQGPRVHTV